MTFVRWYSAGGFFIFLIGCAQVPPQSVELSATLGRDLQELQRSHRKAVDLLSDSEALFALAAARVEIPKHGRTQ
jgi:hypothetical protein